MHGGFYGMIEAAIRGTPLLVIPFFADQFRNGRAAETRGIGRSLQKYDLNYAKLSEALDDLLNNSKYLKASKRLSAMIKNKPNKPREQLIKWTNFVVQFGSLPELSVEGAKLNFIKYFCIDVIAALICLIVIILVVIIRILKFIWMLFPMNNTRMVHKKKL
ncbi:unnamed protein product [Anisakis simplex]|uniref:glucuronosyltransferase n=1 Tax=Anisakis simplex TaxID=6269 RepID=A0A0M3J951_ANISI|nr:unnamed protein product [Anisakis simplex]